MRVRAQAVISSAPAGDAAADAGPRDNRRIGES